MGQLENELSDTQTKLETATKNLEEKEKALQNVRFALKTVWTLIFFEHFLSVVFQVCKTKPVFYRHCFECF